jgi:hypothetical protein
MLAPNLRLTKAVLAFAEVASREGAIRHHASPTQKEISRICDRRPVAKTFRMKKRNSTRKGPYNTMHRRLARCRRRRPGSFRSSLNDSLARRRAIDGVPVGSGLRAIASSC